jgi:hypothetical protein
MEVLKRKLKNIMKKHISWLTDFYEKLSSGSLAAACGQLTCVFCNFL